MISRLLGPVHTSHILMSYICVCMCIIYVAVTNFIHVIDVAM